MRATAVALILTSPLLALMLGIVAGASFFCVALGACWRAARELWRKPRS